MRISFEGAGVDFEKRVVLQPLTLSLVEPRIGVIGLNGSGKTTFARLINGLLKPSVGRVTLDGLDTVRQEKALRGATGFIFQNPANQIILPLIRDDIALGLKPARLSTQETNARVDAVMARFGIVHLSERRPHELSGGELQLAALAAVVVTEPKLILFDEPTNQLDLKNRSMVERAISGLSQQALVISHDLALVEDFERVLVFHQGRLAFDGPGRPAVAHYREIAQS